MTMVEPTKPPSEGSSKLHHGTPSAPTTVSSLQRGSNNRPSRPDSLATLNHHTSSWQRFNPFKRLERNRLRSSNEINGGNDQEVPGTRKSDLGISGTNPKTFGGLQRSLSTGSRNVSTTAKKSQQYPSTQQRRRSTSRPRSSHIAAEATEKGPGIRRPHLTMVLAAPSNPSANSQIDTLSPRNDSAKEQPEVVAMSTPTAKISVVNGLVGVPSSVINQLPLPRAGLATLGNVQKIHHTSTEGDLRDNSLTKSPGQPGTSKSHAAHEQEVREAGKKPPTANQITSLTPKISLPSKEATSYQSRPASEKPNSDRDGTNVNGRDRKDKIGKPSFLTDQQNLDLLTANRALEAKLKAKEDTIQQLWEKIKDLEYEKSNLKSLLDEETVSAQLLKDTTAGAGHLPDSEIQSEWQKLQTRIRQFFTLVNEFDSSASGINNNNGGSGITLRPRPMTSSGQPGKPNALESSSLTQQRLHEQRQHTSILKTASSYISVLRDVAPQFDAYMHSKKGQQALAHAAIWFVLTNEVFATETTTSGMLWCGKFMGTMRKMIAEGAKTQRNSREFHRWRCHSAGFLVSMTSKADFDSNAEEVVHHLECILEHILGSEIVSRDSDGGKEDIRRKSLVTGSTKQRENGNGLNYTVNDRLRARLTDIVHTAINLDQDLCQQQAMWYCEYPIQSSTFVAMLSCSEHTSIGSEEASALAKKAGSGSGANGRISRAAAAPFAFSHATMDIYNRYDGNNADEDDLEVAVMLSPALFKAGNSYGEDYDIPRIIVKSQVNVCKWQVVASAPASASNSASTLHKAAAADVTSTTIKAGSSQSLGLSTTHGPSAETGPLTKREERAAQRRKATMDEQRDGIIRNAADSTKPWRAGRR